MLASSALAVGLVAIPTVASAQEMVLRGFGGVSLPQDAELSYYGYDAEISAETGFVVGGALGVAVGDFVLEGELAYRAADLDELTVLGYGYDLTDSDIGVTSLMANAWYEFPTEGNFGIYAGGGIGIANSDLTFLGYEGDSEDFAWQLGAGAHFKSDAGFSYGIAYRYFNVPEISDSQLELSSHDFMFELSKRY
jgi:opacity protein-like surface antigen